MSNQGAYVRTQAADLVMGVDIGTSSSKGVLVDGSGKVRASAIRHHDTASPRPGWYEHNADQWWAEFTVICRELLSGTQGRVAGVGLSGIGPCLLACTADDNPLRPAILYGVDTRAVAEIAEMKRRYSETEIIERCGAPLTSQSVGPKLLWLRRNEPDVWAAMGRFHMTNSYLVSRLTGEYALDHHSASQASPLYDLRKSTWDADICVEIAPALTLPRLLWPGEVAGVVRRDAAAATGLPVGTPVAIGTIDALAEATSVAVAKPGDMLLMYGTTMVAVTVVDPVAVTQPRGSLGLYPGVTPGSRHLAGNLTTAGALVRWLSLLTATPFETLIAEASTVPAGAEGLIVLPHFAGLQVPISAPNIRGAIFGLTMGHGRAHIYRAMLEGIAFGMRHIVEEMKACGASAQHVVAVGGGLRGWLGAQIVSDVLSIKQVVPRETVGAPHGAALLAAMSRDMVDDPTKWNGTETIIVPIPDNARRYDHIYAEYHDTLFRVLTSTSD